MILSFGNRKIQKDGGVNVDKNARGLETYAMLDSRERKESKLEM